MNIVLSQMVRELRTGEFEKGLWVFEPGELVIFDKQGLVLSCVTMLAQVWPPQ